jgi:hypothetical protein
MMKRIIILVALVSLMMTSCVVHRVPKPAAKILIEHPKTEKPKPEAPKSETEKNRITYRITVIIKEVVVDNVEDVESMLSEQKKQKNKPDGMLLAN